MKKVSLESFLQQFQQHTAFQALYNKLHRASNSQLRELYKQAIPLIEQQIWQAPITESVLKDYQQLFHEYESLLANTPQQRYSFIISIPVADRPQHLNACLQSILNLCKKYQYGGIKNNTYKKISVLIADDSKLQSSIDANQALCIKYSQLGLRTSYFGQSQQKEIACQHKGLDNILGQLDLENFHHKGASITRNITYLKLQQLANKKENQNCLFYFIDSDQEFQVSIQQAGEQKQAYAINYFYHLNELFSNTNISLLTGKVVGDPPVSPAVMAGNLLEDLIDFLNSISPKKPDSSCQYHQYDAKQSDDASYHDMAELFGFKRHKKSFNYPCTLNQPHQNRHCFENLASKLARFFDGEHPTRQSFYQYQNISQSVQAARTVYTGNYIFKPENLKYFIPFASLKLRMAGPVLGRIIQSQIAEKFVSANLPMLHKRTLTSLGQSEFRAGVNHSQQCIDLSEEFSRQFFGDVMLFSMTQLNKLGYPSKSIVDEQISEIIQQTTDSLQKKYKQKHQEINTNNSLLKTMLTDQQGWWLQQSDLKNALDAFHAFINNIEHNFGSDAKIYKILGSEETVSAYQIKIHTAIKHYASDMALWKITLGNI